ncbi:HNH endonuclease signature motif containing protein [Luteipulveratus sp. YIM 133132]|uniref:HNH endonuclease signature motif containing protein n=1 Tax=Luteipulveratus flavus TaxID=3031728 RepID=UPI0023B1312B|nr:HNH endonuclease signature motif containing protein [Luteipulveratus sp. YIM 133132]MDE9365426.1 HNH endonuclease signature motif containing protein [Luteipulveratus sp. YIM 133132]
MAERGDVAAWLLMAAGDNRGHGGNSGYDDQPDVYYTWDSTVHQYANLKVGDPIAIWDKNQLLGTSVIEAISQQQIEKPLFRCPGCTAAAIHARKKMEPRYRCSRCKLEFDEPRVVVKSVTEYRSRHDAAWTPLEGTLTRQELRDLCESPKSIDSMRPMRWSALEAALRMHGAEGAVERVAQRAPDISFPQGHKLELVRVRRGQQKFRARLLDVQGTSCAFTGGAPPRVLEAGHLYSYADLGVHHEHGGLLLRRDIHRLFDDGALAVDPGRLRIDVSDELESYDQYASLHDRVLHTDLNEVQVGWLAAHWAEHRAS